MIKQSQNAGTYWDKKEKVTPEKMTIQIEDNTGSRTIQIDSHWTTLKNFKLENARPWCHSWILVQKFTSIYYRLALEMNRCLNMYKISDDLTNFIEKNMKTWRVKLTTERKTWVERSSKELYSREMYYHHYYL